jgi:hypothetical protein
MEKIVASYAGRPVPVTTCFEGSAGFGYERQAVRYLRVDLRAGEVLRCGVKAAGAVVYPEGGRQVRACADGGLELIFDRAGQWVVERTGEPRLLVFVDPAEAWPVPAGARDAAEFGIRADTHEPQTEAINSALREIEATGGGALVFRPGLYRTGTVVLRSGVTVYLHEGAVWQAIDPDEMPVEPEERINRELPKSLIPGARRRFVLAEGVHDAAILGRGVICGNGSEWRRRHVAPRLTTNLLRFVDCRRVRVEGVLLRDSEFWCVHVLHCEDVAFRAVKLVNEIPPRGWDSFRRPGSQSVWNNADGINPDSSRRVSVEDSFFHTGDDCVPVKNTSTWLGRIADVRDVTVRRCVMITPVTALKLGTETLGEAMENIVFEDIEIVECSRAIAADLKDGVTARGVVFRRVRVHRCNRPFDLWIIRREDQADQTRFSRLEDVLFEDVEFCVWGTEGKNGESHVLGRDETHAVEGVVFRRVTVEGRPLRALEAPAFETNAFARGLRFEPAVEPKGAA